ncbi:hypothetical protein Pcinc_042245 [Petrolisthes cinctipes]|uniref:Uncharacterized protein n=1 Tax=Petrolisthes cinctipes TaxID=88211 RepID=A0AAE1BKC7_PETCI|nr:hypothetical protein Pcinc_042245 [Petrolisthes cinctipes]
MTANETKRWHLSPSAPNPSQHLSPSALHPSQHLTPYTPPLSEPHPPYSTPVSTSPPTLHPCQHLTPHTPPLSTSPPTLHRSITITKSPSHSTTYSHLASLAELSRERGASGSRRRATAAGVTQLLFRRGSVWRCAAPALTAPSLAVVIHNLTFVAAVPVVTPSLHDQQ